MEHATGRIQYEAAPLSMVSKCYSQLWQEIEELIKQELTIEEVFYYASFIHLAFVNIHPFSDGNKRIGAFMFVWFLEKNKHRFKQDGEVKINDNGLVALALLVAQSNPNDKELMVQLIINLINSR